MSIESSSNEYIRDSMKIPPETEKLRSNRVVWYGHVMKKYESHVTKIVVNMKFYGYNSRGRPKKICMEI